MYPANITRAEARERSALLTTHAYRVHVDLTGRDPDGQPLAEPEATFWATSSIDFDSGAGHTHLDVIAEAILAADLDGDPVDLSGFTGERLPLTLTEGAHVLTVTARMRYSRTGEGLHRFVDPADDRTYLFSQLEVADARRVYPCFEQPDLKGAFALTVVAPRGWVVLSNAAEVQPTDDGDASRWEFDTTPPISTYITAIIAGEYHTVRDTHPVRGRELPLSLTCRQSMVPYLDADRLFAITKNGFDVFDAHFGEPYPFSDYAQVFVPEFNAGAMENAGCVTIRDEYLFRSRTTAASYDGRDNTILHELAHMWFGDLVTMTWWDDLWLNESFAEWAAHFAQQQIRERTGEGNDPWISFSTQGKTYAYRQDQLPSTHPVAADMVDLEAVELNFDGITYEKGASVLKQLVAFVGLDAFLAGVRDYFAKHAFGNTQLSDLLVCLEASSGRDLSRFTDEWLKTAGVNTLRPHDEVDEHGRFTRFAIEQTAPADYPTLRQHRIGIGLYEPREDGLTLVHRIETDIDGPITEVPELVGVAAPALVLLNDGDLAYAKIRIDRGLGLLTEGIDTLTDGLSRALCWGAAWDMCRDAELSASDHLTLVLQGVGTESDQTTVREVLGEAATDVARYAPPEDRPSLRRRLTAGLARLVKDAEPGSDSQLAFARALASSVSDEQGAAVLQAWLDGEEVPEGLAVDQELRWRLLFNLARVGAIGEAEIAAEAEADKTAKGSESAAGARAAIPTAEAKAEAWRLATADPSVANETHFQICASFVNDGQEEVLAPFVDRYFEVVEAIAAQRDGWGSRSLAIRNHVVERLFPWPLADRAFLERLDAWMESTDLPESLRRMIGERRSDAERALRCQEAASLSS